MSLSNYKVIETASPAELADAVNAAITGGAQPLGSPFAFLESSNRLFFQAVADGAPDSGEVPDTSTVVADGATLAITNSAGTDSHNATATVSAGAFTGIKLASTVAFADNGDTISVRNSAAADAHSATAVVSAGVVTGVNLAATVAMVDNADAITVQNSAGAAVAGSHTATVAAGVLSNVKLAATVAPVVNGQALTGVTPSGVYTDTVTFTVANGVVTGIALS